MKIHRKSYGFTLLELMTVATIIGILSAIAIPNFMNAMIRAKVARSQAEIETLIWAMEMYYVDQDAYPVNQTPGVSSKGDLVPLTTPVPYLSSIPRDIFLFSAHRDRKEFIDEERGGNPYYFYVNFLQTHEKRISIQPYGLEGSANYAMYGMGPAFSTGSNPMVPEQFIFYNPSNGITSSGMIGSFAP